jgi:hypothetical protein
MLTESPIQSRADLVETPIEERLKSATKTNTDCAIRIWSLRRYFGGNCGMPLQVRHCFYHKSTSEPGYLGLLDLSTAEYQSQCF